MRYAGWVSDSRAHATRFYGAVALGVVAIAIAVMVTGVGSREGKRGLARAAPLATDIADWCPEGLEPIAGGCFAPALPTAQPRGLLVYLHGRYAPEGQNEERERQTRVARMGAARGYAVLALRGLQGQCTDPPLATWWCWPSNERNASDGAAFVLRWDAALREAERRGGRGRRVLLGFSNGGYFAALIASRALLPLDAIAIAHAGPVQPMHPVGRAAPMLLIDADDDPSGPEMDHLEADLTREAWPHAMVAREGGHALPEWDVEMALTFFDRTRTDALPLSPPLSVRPRRIHPPPAEPPSEDLAASAASASPSASAPASASAAPDPPPDDSVLSPPP